MFEGLKEFKAIVLGMNGLEIRHRALSSNQTIVDCMVKFVNEYKHR